MFCIVLYCSYCIVLFVLYINVMYMWRTPRLVLNALFDKTIKSRKLDVKDNYYPDGLPSRSDVTRSRKLGVKDNYYRSWWDPDGFPWYTGRQSNCMC